MSGKIERRSFIGLCIAAALPVDVPPKPEMITLRLPAAVGKTTDFAHLVEIQLESMFAIYERGLVSQQTFRMQRTRICQQRPVRT